jgi:hypothetical protein
MGVIPPQKKKKKRKKSLTNIYFGPKVTVFPVHKKDGLQFNVSTEVFMMDHQFHLVFVS